MLIILFAVDIAKKNGIIPLCVSRREKYVSGAAIFGAAAPPDAARAWLSYPTIKNNNNKKQKKNTQKLLAEFLFKYGVP